MKREGRKQTLTCGVLSVVLKISWLDRIQAFLKKKKNGGKLKVGEV